MVVLFVLCLAMGEWARREQERIGFGVITKTPEIDERLDTEEGRAETSSLRDDECDEKPESEGRNAGSTQPETAQADLRVLQQDIARLRQENANLWAKIDEALLTAGDEQK